MVLTQTKLIAIVAFLFVLGTGVVTCNAQVPTTTTTTTPAKTATTPAKTATTPAKTATTPAKTATPGLSVPVGVTTKAHTRDVALANIVGSAIEANAHNEKCLLVTVVSPAAGANRDLGIVSISDLAAGARVEIPNVVDEAGFAITIVGLNAFITLTEASFFGARTLVHGQSLDEFKINAGRKGYTTFSAEIECQANIRQDQLHVLARSVMKAQQLLRKSK